MIVLAEGEAPSELACVMPPIGELKRGKHDGTTVVGSKSACMYVGGVVYKLMYTQNGLGQRDRMKPEDVWLVSWENLINVARLEFDDKTHKATVIRLEFSQAKALKRWAGVAAWVTKELILKRSTRNDTLRRLWPVLREKWHKSNGCLAAFLMGTHAQLGEQSLVQVLSPEMARLVWSCHLAESEGDSSYSQAPHLPRTLQSGLSIPQTTSLHECMHPNPIASIYPIFNLQRLLQNAGKKLQGLLRLGFQLARAVA
jgi:hypothetical protein